MEATRPRRQFLLDFGTIEKEISPHTDEQRQEQLVAALQEANGSTAELSLELKKITDELGLLMSEWEQLVELMKMV